MIPKDVTDMKEFEEYVLNLIEKSQDIGNELEQRIYQTNPTTTEKLTYFLKYIGIISQIFMYKGLFYFGRIHKFTMLSYINNMSESFKH